jgi:hypothetical protein
MTITGLAVNAGTVTFNVSWNKNNAPALWSDTAWVFVDYNDAGVMKRLPLSTGATLTATSAPGVGKVVEISGNTDGVWVVGNARDASSGSFSATVKLHTATTTATGACVYASNYPPVGEYTSATHISFTGTAPYKMILKDNGNNITTVSITSSSYVVPPGYTVQGFSDKTGAPGILKCVPATVYDLKMSATEFCSGTTVAFALSNTISGRTYRLYKGGTAVMDALAGTGGAATFTGTFAGKGVYTAQVTASGSNCGAVMNGSHIVTERNLPTAPVIGKPADVCYNTGNLVFTATGYSGVVEWTSNGGGTANNNTVTFASGAATGTKTVVARSAQSYSSTLTCYSGTVTQSANVNALPGNPIGVDNTRHNTGTVTISASSPGAVIDWYSAASGGSSLCAGNSYTPTITGSTTYYAEAKITATGCISAGRTAVVATMLTSPANPTGVGNTRCGAGTVTISALSSNSGAVIDWYNAATGGTSLTTGNSYTTPSITTSTTYYAESRYTSSGEVSVLRTPVVANVYELPLPPTITVASTTTAFTPATFTATGGSGSYLWTDAFDGKTGAILYASTTAGIYQARAMSYVELPSGTCYGTKSNIAAGYVYGNTADGGTCTSYIQCASRAGCVCNVCTNHSGSCANNYGYYTISTSRSSAATCTSGWTKVTGCAKMPFTAQINLYNCTGSMVKNCYHGVLTANNMYSYTCNTSTGAVSNAKTENCYHCCDDRQCSSNAFCYRKLK